MSERLTVVFDDEELYRRLKVWAAERRLPIKRVVEDALREHLGPAPEDLDKPIDWEEFDRWQQEAERLDREAGGAYPIDLSAVKDQLYGRQEPGLRALAEERGVYDA